jgi:hypothetical protein
MLYQTPRLKLFDALCVQVNYRTVSLLEAKKVKARQRMMKTLKRPQEKWWSF